MLKDEPCLVARCVNLIEDRWSLLILRDAFDGVCRFKDFQQSLGGACNILFNRLKKLVDAGVLEMQDASDGKAYQEYVLTAKGESLFPMVIALQQSGEYNLFESGEHHSLLIDKNTDQQIPFMAAVGQDGKLLEGSDTRVQKVK